MATQTYNFSLILVVKMEIKNDGKTCPVLRGGGMWKSPIMRLKGNCWSISNSTHILSSRSTSKRDFSGKTEIYFLLWLWAKTENGRYQPLLRACQLRVPSADDVLLSYHDHHKPLEVSGFGLIWSCSMNHQRPSCFPRWLHRKLPDLIEFSCIFI